MTDKKGQIKVWNHRFLLGLGILLVISACSRKKDKWINRNFHTMSTYYNILYNGNLVLDKGVEGLAMDNTDDYWEILPVEQFLNFQEPVEYGQMLQIDPGDLPLRFADDRPNIEMERPDPTRRQEPQEKPDPSEEPENKFPQQRTQEGIEPGQANIDSVQSHFAQNRNTTDQQNQTNPQHVGQEQMNSNLPPQNNQAGNQGVGQNNQQNQAAMQQGGNYTPARNQQNPNAQGQQRRQHQGGVGNYQGGNNSGQVQSGGGYQPMNNQNQQGNAYSNNQGYDQTGGYNQNRGRNQTYGGNQQGGNQAYGNNQNYGGNQGYGNNQGTGGGYGNAGRGNQQQGYGGTGNQAYGNSGNYGGGSGYSGGQSQGNYGQTGNYGNNQQGGGYSERNSRNPSQNPSESYQIGDFYGESRPFQGIAADEAFQLAEEKATKAIKDHSMLIKNEEKNRLIGDAYLLLGKSRYYDQRYFPALDVFNYIMSHFYEDGELISSAEIWREKVYLRLENNERVARNIPAILKGEPARDSVRFSTALSMSKDYWNDTTDIAGSLLKGRVQEKIAINRNISFHTKEDITEATSALAQAFLNLGEKEKAIEALNIAIGNTRDVEKRGRFLFIKGQIFERLEQIDSATAAYDEVIALNRRIPRTYFIQAHLGKIRHFDPVDSDAKKQIKYIDRLLKDRENRPFLDLIHYHAGTYYQLADSTALAMDHYKKSVSYDFWDPGLKSRAYSALADHHFQKATYQKAAAYYDSTMVNLPALSREYRNTAKKRRNLNDVIVYEAVAERNDSILKLAEMAPEERGLYFKNYTDELKAEAIDQAEKQTKKEKRSRKNQSIFGKQKSALAGGGSSGGFYFYDAQQVAAGEQVFKQIWGDRGLRDNWRTESRRGDSDSWEIEERDTTEETEEERDLLAEIEADPRFDSQTYLDQIPDDQTVLDSITEERNFVYYQLGILYHEKFKEDELAADKLEKVLDNQPEERLVLPTKYNLYRIYEALGLLDKSEKLRRDIIQNHEDSRYALALTNPEKLKDDKRNPDKIYEGIYEKYKAQAFEEVIEETDEYITEFNGEAIVAKMELLRALAIGRLYGIEAYEQALNYVALNYPQREEGKKAGQILNESLPGLKNAEIVMDLNGWHNLIYPFAKTERGQAEALQRQIDKAIKEFEMEDAKTTIDVYNPEKIFLVVSGLHNRIQAEDFGDKLEEEKEYKIKKDRFGISSKNYKTLLFHKNLEEYLQKFKF